jgi:hypothetical protein
MDDLTFRIAFWDARGALIDIMSIPAATLTSASQRAREMAAERRAVSFIMTEQHVLPERTQYSPLKAFTCSSLDGPNRDGQR